MNLLIRWQMSSCCMWTLSGKTEWQSTFFSFKLVVLANKQRKSVYYDIFLTGSNQLFPIYQRFVSLSMLVTSFREIVPNIVMLFSFHFWDISYDICICLRKFKQIRNIGSVNDKAGNWYWSIFSSKLVDEFEITHWIFIGGIIICLLFLKLFSGRNENDVSQAFFFFFFFFFFFILFAELCLAYPFCYFIKWNFQFIYI